MVVAQILFVIILPVSPKLTLEYTKRNVIMGKLGENYRVNVATLDSLLHPDENFDVIRKVLRVGQDEMTLYYIDGFVKDAVMQKMMVHFLSLKSLGERTDRSAQDFLFHNIPYVEADVTDDIDNMVQMMLSGATVMLGSAFLNRGIIIDARTYPARDTAEPENDRVIKGARDGFVETLIFNTALIRRRIRDPKLKMSYMNVGTRSKTDVVVCYIEDKAEKEKPKKKYRPKPYEQMQYPGQRIQIDVKVVPRYCIADPQLKLYQYTAIDEYSRYRILGAYPEQSTYSSADFLRKVVASFARRGVKVECVQTDNGFEFTNRFSNSKRDLQTLFERTAAELGVFHKLIRPYTPRHNGKVERSHREDQKRFYSDHRFYSLADFGAQLAAHQSRSNSRPMRPLRWASPSERLNSFPVQYV